MMQMIYYSNKLTNKTYNCKIEKYTNQCKKTQTVANKVSKSTPEKLTDLLEPTKIIIEEVVKKYALNYQQLSFLENSFTNSIEITKLH